MYFCPKIRFLVLKIVLNENLPVLFTFKTIFGTGNRIFEQKYIGDGLFQKFVRIFSTIFFEKNAYFRHKSALESGRKLKKIVWGP